MKYQYLNKQDEYKLIEAYQNGDESALKDILKFNKLNIKMIVNSIRNPFDSDYKDAIQEANISLIRAIKGFDITSNNRLISYASKIIYNDLIRQVMVKASTIKIPLRIYQDFRKIEKGETNNVHKNTIIASSYNYNTYDIDEHINDDCNSYESDILNFDRKQLIEDLLMELKEDDRIVLIHRFGLFDKPIMKHYDIGKTFYDDNISNKTKENYNIYSMSRFYKSIKKLKQITKMKNIKF